MVAITTELLCAVLFSLFCYSFLKMIQGPGWPNVLGNALSLSGLFLTRQLYLALLPEAVLIACRLRRDNAGERYLIAIFVVVEFAVLTFYGDEVCHVNVVGYARQRMMTALKFRLSKWGILSGRRFDPGWSQWSES